MSYSYLVLTQQNGLISKREYSVEMDGSSYFSQDFPVELIYRVAIERTDCYICRMPMHLVGPGIPFNAAVLEYSATDEELKQIRSSIIKGDPEVDPDGIFVYGANGQIRILNLTGPRFNFTKHLPPFLKGLHIYTYIVPFKKILGSSFLIHELAKPLVYELPTIT